MFRLTAALVTGLAALPIALAAPAMAMASTATPVSMTFDEPVLENVNSGCALPNGLCGNGVVVPYGHATEMIAFGVACGGGCDVRTVTLSSGSIVMDEYATGGACFGACAGPQPPGRGTLSDVIVGGTGIFTGASGNLSGTVTVTSLQSQVQLSGTITLPS
jgi:hypothetical protein